MRFGPVGLNQRVGVGSACLSAVELQTLLDLLGEGHKQASEPKLEYKKHSQTDHTSDRSHLRGFMVQSASEGVRGKKERRRKLWVRVCIFYRAVVHVLHVQRDVPQVHGNGRRSGSVA